MSTAVPAPDASVRRAGPNDAPAVGAVQAAVWTQAYATHLPDEVLAAFTPAAFGTAWRASLTRPPAGIHQLLVALTGARIVGFVTLGPAQDPDADADQAEITAIGVHPGARGEGHGSAPCAAQAASRSPTHPITTTSGASSPGAASPRTALTANAWLPPTDGPCARSASSWSSGRPHRSRRDHSRRHCAAGRTPQ